MKKTRSKLFYALAILFGSLFVIACLAGFAACGESEEDDENGGEVKTYTFEAEYAQLWADESEMWYWLENDVTDGNMIIGMGFLYGVQEVETASGGMSVGYLAHNNPTATFVINSSKAVTGVKLTLGAASCDINKDSIQALLGSYVYGLSLSSINSYAGADHDILTVNGSKAALSGTLAGSNSVFKTGGSIDDMDLAMDNWGTLTATIDLAKGDNTIVLTHDGAGVNWDYIQIETDAVLSWTTTDNDGFVSYDEDYEPDDTGDQSTTEDESKYANTLTLEAENGALINSAESYGNDTEALTTEENSTYTGVTNVKNFNVAGDQIILQVYADEAIESVNLDLYGWASSSGGLSGYSYSDYQKLITVNDTAVEYTGSFGTTYDSSTSKVAATISLQKGMNFIVIELEKTGTRLSTLNLGGINVDRVELSWTVET